MTALADNKEILEKDGKLLSFPVVASDIIYKGALVKINAAGYLAPQAAEAGAASVGVAYELCDNSAGSAGAKKCLVLHKGVFLLTCAGTLVQADVGSTVYASDDQTVSVTQASNEVAVGKVVEYVSATQGWIELL